MNSQQIRALPLPAGWYWSASTLGQFARTRPASEVEQVVFDVFVEKWSVENAPLPGIIRRLLGRLWPSLLPTPPEEEFAYHIRFRTERVHNVNDVHENFVLYGVLPERFEVDINTFDFDRFEEYLALIETDRLAEALE